MTAAPLWQVSVVAEAAHEQLVTECLARVFSESVSSYIDLERGQVRVSVYCPVKPARELVGRLKRDLSRQSAGDRAWGLRVEVRYLKPRDWANAWKLHFKPISIGRSLLVKPSWSKRQPGAGQSVVVLDPGLSFGTGQHPTTRYCLERIATLRPGGESKSFLDVGTGSGILAIAARKLGYRPVDAMDHDAVAVRIAHSNARRNRVQVRIWRGEVARLRRRRRAGYDVVCANLTSGLLIGCAGELTAQVGLNGCLVLAGVLRVEFGRVRAAYEGMNWRLAGTQAVGEWQSGLFVSI
jgi:ribosomal protein L11 methyltransferase